MRVEEIKRERRGGGPAICGEGENEFLSPPLPIYSALTLHTSQFLMCYILTLIQTICHVNPLSNYQMYFHKIPD